MRTLGSAELTPCLETAVSNRSTDQCIYSGHDHGPDGDSSSCYAPATSLWLNLEDRFFADLTEDSLRAGGFPSVEKLTDAIMSDLPERNENPRPHQWRASGKEILGRSIALGRSSLRP